MEQDTQNLLEMIDRPAFLVQGGVITYANQMAKNRQIALGTPIATLLAEAADAYESFQGGTLYLTLNIGWVKCGATVLQQNEDHIFLLDRDADICQLQALALAGQQLRTPLSNVMTVADSLFPELTEPQQKEQASQMTRALFQLMRLVSNMADAERYSGLESPTFENTELCSFFREIAEKANEALAENKISVRFECREKAIFSGIDRERIQRAVYNLLSNAAKFSAPESAVTLKLTRTKTMACISVEDQGSGIASHVQGSLFHRYMREPAIEDKLFSDAELTEIPTFDEIDENGIRSIQDTRLATEIKDGRIYISAGERNFVYSKDIGKIADFLEEKTLICYDGKALCPSSPSRYRSGCW